MPYIAPQAEQHTAVGRTSSVTGHITNQGTMVITGTFTVQMATIKSDQSQRRRTLGRVSGIYDDPEAYELACACRGRCPARLVRAASARRSRPDPLGARARGRPG